MRTYILLSLACSCIWVSAPVNIEAQSACTTPDSSQQRMLSGIRKLMLITDPDVVDARIRAGIPLVSDTSKIVWVTDDRICKKIRDGYAAYLQANGAPRSVGATVLAVKVGNVFVVRDDFRSPDSEWVAELTMDSKYRVIYSGLS